MTDSAEQPKPQQETQSSQDTQGNKTEQAQEPQQSQQQAQDATPTTRRNPSEEVKQAPEVAQAQQSREFYEMLLKLRLSYTNEVVAKIQRLDDLIGEAHSYTVGSYKEHVIREQVVRITPRKFSVNTGFVVGNRSGTITRSKQIDVLIWDSTNYAPIVQAGELVVIQPEALRAAVEVKGMLDHEELEDAINNLESLTQFSREMMQVHPRLSHDRFPFTRFLVACDLDTNKSGKNVGQTKLSFPDAFWNKLRSIYKDEVIGGRINWCAPWGEYAAMAWINGIAVVGYGYIGASVHTSDPKFVSYTLLSEVDRSKEATKDDESVGMFLAHLELALTHPKSYSSDVGQMIFPKAPQMALPDTATVRTLVPGAYRPRKPTKKKVKERQDEHEPRNAP